MIDLKNMFEAYKILGKEALGMNHYDLTAYSDADYSADEWKEFLSQKEVQDYIRKEMDIIRASEINKIVQDSSDSRSVAKAQILGALTKLDEDKSEKEGPVFIYCHVPLNDEQKFAPNVLEWEEPYK